MTDRANYWQRMVSTWESSGLTQAEFCGRRGLKSVTFGWWKRRLRGPIEHGRRGRRGRDRRSRVGGKANVDSVAASFMEVALPASAGRPAFGAATTGFVAAGYEVALPCGASIRLPGDFDVDKASHLISAVSRSC